MHLDQWLDSNHRIPATSFQEQAASAFSASPEESTDVPRLEYPSNNRAIQPQVLAEATH
jgi:hypothetical protein